MKAFVHKADDAGQPICATGFVTGEYMSLRNLKLYALADLKPGRYLLRAYYNWSKCYGSPDVEELFTVT